jgi:hypothetical protein
VLEIELELELELGLGLVWGIRVYKGIGINNIVREGRLDYRKEGIRP